jgi:hypothetical protein
LVQGCKVFEPGELEGLYLFLEYRPGLDKFLDSHTGKQQIPNNKHSITDKLQAPEVQTLTLKI